jgi:hypothetical protein
MEASDLLLGCAKRGISIIADDSGFTICPSESDRPALRAAIHRHRYELQSILNDQFVSNVNKFNALVALLPDDPNPLSADEESFFLEMASDAGLGDMQSFPVTKTINAIYATSDGEVHIRILEDGTRETCFL